MSLLREALRARQSKVKAPAPESSTVFNGPVIDADEVLNPGGVDGDVGGIGDSVMGKSGVLDSGEDLAIEHYEVEQRDFSSGDVESNNVNSSNSGSPGANNTNVGPENSYQPYAMQAGAGQTDRLAEQDWQYENNPAAPSDPLQYGLETEDQYLDHLAKIKRQIPVTEGEALIDDSVIDEAAIDFTAIEKATTDIDDAGINAAGTKNGAGFNDAGIDGQGIDDPGIDNPGIDDEDIYNVAPTIGRRRSQPGELPSIALSPRSPMSQAEQVATSTSPHQSSKPPGNSFALDPLFFIIIAFACAGLFGSLYALVTQNDAFVSREYAELRARQSSLNELISQQQLAQEKLAGEVVTGEAVSGKATPDITSLEDDGSSTGGSETLTLAASGSQAQVQTESLQQIVAQSVDQPLETREVLATETIPLELAVSEPAVSKPAVSKPAETSTIIRNAQAEKGSADQIARLQRELDELKKALASQDSRITGLVQENSDLQSLRKLQSELQQRQSESEIPAAASSAMLTSDNDAATTPQTRKIVLLKNKGKVAEDDSVIPLAKNNPLAADGALISPESGVDSVVYGKNRVTVDYQSSDFAETLGRAFQAYNAHDMRAAAGLYDRALQLDPYNRDANLGVAAVAMQADNYLVAKERYLHLLSLQPDDVVAFSAVLNLARVTRDYALENEMVVHGAQHPRIAPLQAALGNYYSRNERWGEASHAYASAVGLAPETPDYLFNLAVSLDHLGDAAAARESYQRAISLSEVSSYSFNIVEASARVTALQYQNSTGN